VYHIGTKTYLIARKQEKEMSMCIHPTPSRPKASLEQQIHRLGGIIDVMIHLFPESSDVFEYDEELFTLILVARDLTHDIRDQVDQGKPLETFAGSAAKAAFLHPHQTFGPDTDAADGCADCLAE
jgi:hypothetical protein